MSFQERSLGDVDILRKSISNADLAKLVALTEPFWTMIQRMFPFIRRRGVVIESVDISEEKFVLVQ